MTRRLEVVVGHDAAGGDAVGDAALLTVVVEDYYQVGAFAGVIRAEHWHRFESRIEHSTQATLALLAEADARATFFVSGWIAQRVPWVVAEIASQGHRVAAQGLYCTDFEHTEPEAFRKDLRQARSLVEQACGERVYGFRISRGGLDPRNCWPLDVLAEEGFAYDSSLRPLGPASRFPSPLRGIHRARTPSSEILEVPVSSWAPGGYCLPVAGGNFMRQMPQSLYERAVRASAEATNGMPQVFYFHAWELDPEQPTVAGASRLQRLRHYRNLDRMGQRIRALLTGRRFGAIEDFLRLDRAPVVPAKSERKAAPSDALMQAGASSNATPVSVVVPCYNEAQNIEYLFTALRRLEDQGRGIYDFDFICVDDGSRDDTLRLLQERTSEHPNLKVIAHERNRGIAAAVLTGIQASTNEVVCCIDCDCTFDPSQLLTMLPMLGPDVDMVAASPFMVGGQVENVPAWRRALSQGANRLYRGVLKAQLASYTACFRVYRRAAVADARLHFDGFCGITELLAHIDLKGGTIVECPAVLETRLFGESKIRILHSIRDHLLLILRLFTTRREASGAASGTP